MNRRSCEATKPMDMIKRDSVVEMVAQVAAAQREVRDAFGLLMHAKSRLHKTLGAYHDYVLPQNFVSETSLDRAAGEAAKRIERNAWRAVVSRLNVREIISVKKRQELDRQLEEGELPPLTDTNVYAFMQQLFMDMDSLLEDSAREVFDWLRPRWRTDLKTNEKNKFGLTNKVIVKGAMEDNTWGRKTHMPTRLAYHNDQYFHVLDNVFHLLDGRGVSKYPDDLCTRIADAGGKGESEVVTDYFEIKWFLNRNMHIVFRRMDLVDKLNQLAGSGQLREGKDATEKAAQG